MISRIDITREGLSDESLSLLYRDLFKLDANLSSAMVDTADVRLRRRRVWEEVRPHFQGQAVS